MEQKFVLTQLNHVTMGFLLQDGKVESIKCYEEASILGNIYVARVSNIVPNINAAFVDIAKGESCYLPLEDYEETYHKNLKIGDLVLVQINKDKIKSKQASVTTNVSLTGNYVVVQTNGVIGASSKISDEIEKEKKKNLVKDLINKQEFKCKDISYGAIIRTEAFSVSDDILTEETIRLLCKLDDLIHQSIYATAYSCLMKKESMYLEDIKKYLRMDDVDVVSDLQDFSDSEYVKGLVKKDGIRFQYYNDESFSLIQLYRLKSQVEKALSKRAYLKSGAYLVIEPTEAMVVIDVNSGKAIKGKASEETLFKINVEAAKEIARQLRLRNLSGMILVDFISMKSEEYQKKLLELLKEEVLFDQIQTIVVDITKLGIVEMTRKKISKPLHEVLYGIV